MTVKELKEQLVGVSDDALIMVQSSVNRYRTANVDFLISLYNAKEFFIDEATGKPIKRTQILLFS